MGALKIVPFTRTSNRKLNFRIVIDLFNVILFALLPAGGVLTVGNNGDYIFDMISITAPAISVLWTSIAICLLLASSLKPRYHPAIDLTFDATSWLAFWILGGFLITQTAASEGLIVCSPSYGGVPNDRYCQPDGTRKWNLNAAAAAFMVINGLIHLVFFGIACHEVKIWRRDQWGLKRDLHELDRI